MKITTQTNKNPSLDFAKRNNSKEAFSWISLISGAGVNTPMASERHAKTSLKHRLK